MKGLRQAVATLVAGLVFCGGMTAEARDMLRVGIRPLGDGVITQDAQGNFYGAETDYMQTLTSYAGMDVTFVPGTWDENIQRLASGDIDAIAGIARSAELEEQLWYSRLPIGWSRGSRVLLAPVGPHQVTSLYYAVQRGNEALYDRLETANDSLAANRPYFIEQITRSYQVQRPAQILRLSRVERDYLVRHPVLHAVAVARERPFSFVDENGAFAGEIRRLADRIAADLGVTIETQTVQSYDAAYAAIEDGSADLLLNMDWDISFAEAHAIAPTIPYSTDYYTAVTRRSGASTHPVIACVENRTMDRVLRSRYADDQIRVYPTPEACLVAVKNGEADLTFLRQETAQYEIWQGAFPDLRTDGTVAFTRQNAIGVSERVSEALLPILDKEIDAIGPQAMKDGLAAQTATGTRSWRALIYTYPFYFRSC